ncbi:hypothetical protein Hanom_Chr10g00915151 [Helianthus anomalus]
MVDQLRTNASSTEQSKGAYCWNLLSGMLEWSWVEIHGNARRI